MGCCCFSVAVSNTCFFNIRAYFPKVRHWIRPWYGVWFCLFHCPLSNFSSGKPSKTCHIGHWCQRWRMKKYVSTAKEYKMLLHSCIKYGLWWFSPFKWNKKCFLWFLAVSMALISYEAYFNTKNNCEKPLCTGIGPSFFCNWFYQQTGSVTVLIPAMQKLSRPLTFSSEKTTILTCKRT